MKRGNIMKKIVTNKLVNIEFEVNDVQAFGLDGIVRPMYCADDFTSGCFIPPSAAPGCTTCNMTVGCQNALYQACVGGTDH